MDDFPVALIQDRYRGVYSGGKWLAIAEASELVDTTNTRVQFCLTDDRGPFGPDPDAAGFWAEPPCWIASGETPTAALEALGQGTKRKEAKHNSIRKSIL
jgi:hypothetical protein